jgi:prevent-host-death family protein
MEQIGMRELRHRLRHYLTRVDAGSTFEVTVFGRPVARLSPLDSRPHTLQRLIEEGKLTPASNPDTGSLPAAAPNLTTITATEALLAERRSDPR